MKRREEREKTWRRWAAWSRTRLPTIWRVPEEGEAEELISARGSDAGPLRILFVGNLIARKGLHHLIAVLSRLPWASWRLDVVGDEAVDIAYAAAVRRQVGAAGLEEQHSPARARVGR